MLPENITETLFVLGLFAVRVGIPIAITLAFGAWLEKKLRPRDEQLETTRKIEMARRLSDRRAKVIQLHCWDLHHCESTQRAQCAAFKHPELPCWLALQVEGGKVRQGCFTCGLYQPKSAAA